MLAMGRDAAQTEDGRYRLLVEAVTDYAIWVLILGIKYQVQRLKKSVDAPCFSSAF
jgi:hypothetical protein